MGIREIENYIDSRHKSLSIIKKPILQAVWKTISALELYLLKSRILSNPSDIEKFVLADRVNYSMKWALFWLYQSCPKDKVLEIPCVLHKNFYNEATGLMNLAYLYNEIQPLFPLLSKSIDGEAICRAETLENKVIFENSDIESKLHALDGLIKIIKARKSSLDYANHYLSSYDASIYERMKNAIEHTGFDAIKITPSIDDMKNSKESIKKAYERTFLFPNGWNFHGIKIVQFREFWVSLLSLATYYWDCYSHVIMNSLSAYPLGFASLPPVFSKMEFTTLLSMLIEDIAPEELHFIVNLFIYDPMISKPDPALQPLIELTDNKIALPPGFYRGLDHERNLMSFLSKNHKPEYDSVSNVLHESLLKELKSKLEDNYRLVAIERNINSDSLKTDIDFAIYESRSKQFIIAEVKWVIAPGDVSDIFSRAETEKKGIEQINALIDFFEDSPIKLWKYLFPLEDVPQDITNSEITYCVVMRGFTGSSWNFNEDIPVVEETIFASKIKLSSNLRHVADWLNNRDYLPKENVDFKNVREDVQFGDYIFNIPKYEIIDNPSSEIQSIIK
jgi:flagellin-specific chaperone FliS